MGSIAINIDTYQIDKEIRIYTKVVCSHDRYLTSADILIDTKLLLITNYLFINHIVDYRDKVMKIHRPDN